MRTVKQIKKILVKFFRILADKYERLQNTCSVPSQITKSISGWSVVIITDGANNESLRALIESAKNELSSTQYEIIIVGPPELSLELGKNSEIKHIPYNELKLPFVRGWITLKKNIGVRASKYDKVVVCHDYIIFKKGWKNGFDSFGSFDVASNIFTNKDGTRHRDWITLDYPDIGRGLLPYHAKCTKYQYLNGAYFVVRRDFFLENPLNEHLRWGESEDIEWSKRIRKKTVFRFNQNSSITYSKQKPGNNAEWDHGTKQLEKVFNGSTFVRP